jgi:hypothetical protein
VMSLNVMPFFGKSGTSRTAARSLSTVSEAIGANASGLYSNVNQSRYGKARLNGPTAIAPDLQSKCVQTWCLILNMGGSYVELPTGNANLQ